MCESRVTIVQTLNTVAKLGDDALAHVAAHRFAAKRSLHLPNQIRVSVSHRQTPSTSPAHSRSPRRIHALLMANDPTRVIGDNPCRQFRGLDITG